MSTWSLQRELQERWIILGTGRCSIQYVKCTFFVLTKHFGNKLVFLVPKSDWTSCNMLESFSYMSKKYLSHTNINTRIRWCQLIYLIKGTNT